MKRVWAVILAAALALSLAACGKEESGTGGKLPSGARSTGQSERSETSQSGSADGGDDWFLSDNEANIRIATELLCEADEVRDCMALGMSVQYTGEHEFVDGRECWLFALGTDRDGQFVRERYYAVCDNCIYGYDAIDDSWQMLGMD